MQTVTLNQAPAVEADVLTARTKGTWISGDLIELWSNHNRATDGTTKVDSAYLEVVAVRK